MMISLLLQILQIIFIFILLSFFRGTFKKYWPKDLRKKDLMTVLLLYLINKLSIFIWGISIIPHLIFIMSFIGIVMTLYLARKNGIIKMKDFWIRLLRITDLLAIIVYVVLFFLAIFKIFS